MSCQCKNILNSGFRENSEFREENRIQNTGSSSGKVEGTVVEVLIFILPRDDISNVKFLHNCEIHTKIEELLYFCHNFPLDQNKPIR